MWWRGLPSNGDRSENTDYQYGKRVATTDRWGPRLWEFHPRPQLPGFAGGILKDSDLTTLKLRRAAAESLFTGYSLMK